MKNCLITLVLLLYVIINLSAQEPMKPYNPEQNLREELKKAMDRAKNENKHILVQFGGNWCPWCMRFHAMVKGDFKLDSLIRADYIYVLANVPHEKDKRDWELFREYEYPNRFGYPVFVILDGNGRKLHTQDSGLLESGQGYDTTKVITFLKEWNVKALDPKTYSK